MGVFTSQERQLARSLGSLSFSNPFTAEQVQVEKEILQDDYVGDDQALSFQPDTGNPMKNLEGLKHHARILIYTAHENLSRGISPIEDEMLVYEDLTLFVLFHRYRIQFEQVVKDVLSGNPSPNLGFTLYEEFKADAIHFFGVPHMRQNIIDETPHIFACFFQLRRAFLYIFHFIVGHSKPAAQFRTAIWQSIFTHDMRRYRRRLYDKMGTIPTLITGPSGTGKELVARAIGLSRYIPFDVKQKSFSRYFDEGFYAINLSALSETVIESELFGHRKGAFTGAISERLGYFEEAGNLGSVFLDEIGEVNESIQVKLLRVLQTRSFQRLGDTENHQFNGKIIAATNRNLDEEMHRGTFREDFYYRLCADRIVTPGLHEQLKDNPDSLPQLIKFIARRVAGEEEAHILTQESQTWIQENLPQDYTWPGNIRELEQCIRNILIRKDYTPPHRQKVEANSLDSALAQASMSAEELLGQYCTHMYHRMGSYEKAASVLGMDRRTVKNHIQAKLLEKLQLG
jgi:DNA-binding NtrC family response regulator